MPQIQGGTLDADNDASNIPVEATPDVYIAAQDSLIAAIQSDKGLTVAAINQYLPVVENALANAATAFPGAGTLISGILKVLPKQI